MVNQPVRGPGGYGPVGAKRTAKVHAPFGGSLNGATGHPDAVPGFETVNSEVAEYELTVSSIPPVFAMLTVTGLLVVPITCETKLTRGCLSFRQGLSR